MDLLGTYRRILEAARHGRGVRLSADEVAAMVGDTAIRQVVDTAEEEEAEKSAAGGAPVQNLFEDWD